MFVQKKKILLMLLIVSKHTHTNFWSFCSHTEVKNLIASDHTNCPFSMRRFSVLRHSFLCVWRMRKFTSIHGILNEYTKHLTHETILSKIVHNAVCVLLPYIYFFLVKLCLDSLGSNSVCSLFPQAHHLGETQMVYFTFETLDLFDLKCPPYMHLYSKVLFLSTRYQTCWQPKLPSKFKKQVSFSNSNEFRKMISFVDLPVFLLLRFLFHLLLQSCYSSIFYFCKTSSVLHFKSRKCFPPAYYMIFFYIGK